MHSAILIALAATTLAADVSVVWRREVPSGRTSLTVHSEKDNFILAESCGNSIGSLDFSSVSQRGAGSFTLDGKTFDILSKSQEDVSCTRMFNNLVTVVECSNVKFDVPAGASTAANCFSHEDAKESFFALRKRNIDGANNATTIEQRSFDEPQLSRIERRQQCYDQKSTFPVGDGNPHQNYFHKQLSEVINCAAATACQAGHEVSKSFTVGFSSSASAYGWISAGFDVQKSWSTGNQYTCQGERGQDVCIWYNTAHTAYTVRNSNKNTCNGSGARLSDPFVIKSPNKANRGGGMYCVIGTCRAQGDGYWDDTGRAGGP